MPELHVEIPPAALECLSAKSRYKVLKGGRGGGKSHSIAKMILVRMMAEKMVILCTREFQTSIKDSVHRLLSRQIEQMGLGQYFEIQKATIICTKTGSEAIFAGLADKTVDSIKSLEGAKICWVEEAQTVSDRSWQLLIPTIRVPDSEIWISFNPDEETDPTYQRFIVNAPPNCAIATLNWNDNPWLPDVLREEKDYLYSVDPDTAAHVWGGACRKASDAQILRGRYRVQEFEPKPGLWDGPYQGIDFGFAQDLGTFVRCWIWEGDLYIEYESAGLEIDTDLLPSYWDEIPGARDYIARADCSRPETISQVKRLGYKRVIGCTKWTGCEKDGIDHIRSYKNIIIHPRCPEAAKEARLWSWKKNKGGDILPETTGKFDNTWAAVRYALEPVILHGLKDRVEEEEDYLVYNHAVYGGNGRKSWAG